jgi:hypothetical protein
MADQINKIIINLEKTTTKRVISLALNIHGGLVEDTPVDTGWAKSNWLPSIKKPKRELVGAPNNINQIAVITGIAEVTGWNIVDEQPIYISNNVPYMRRLNDGSSKQAPSGFIESRIKQEVNKMNKRRIK